MPQLATTFAVAAIVAIANAAYAQNNNNANQRSARRPGDKPRGKRRSGTGSRPLKICLPRLAKERRPSALKTGRSTKNCASAAAARAVSGLTADRLRAYRVDVYAFEIAGAARGIRTPDPVITNYAALLSPHFRAIPCVSAPVRKYGGIDVSSHHLFPGVSGSIPCIW
jgi:hypothetical protein